MFGFLFGLVKFVLSAKFIAGTLFGAQFAPEVREYEAKLWAFLKSKFGK